MAKKKVNDEIIDKSIDLLNINSEINEIIKEEASNEEKINEYLTDSNEKLNSIFEKKQEILDINNNIIKSENDNNIIVNKINNSLDDTIDKKDIINDLNNRIYASETDINNSVGNYNNSLDNTIDKKILINDLNNDINRSESDLNDSTVQHASLLDDIVSHRQKELYNLQQSVVEQQKLYGFSSQVLSNLQAAVTAQQQLNAAMANQQQGNVPPTPPSSGNSNNTQSQNKNNNNKRKRQRKGKFKQNWYSKGNIAKSLFQGSVNLIQKFGTEAIKKWIEIDKHVYTTGRQLGMTSSQMRGMQKNILSNYGEMANRLGMTFEEIFKFQESYNKSVGRSVILTNKQVESFASLSKMMGETAVNDMAKNMDDFGASSSTAIDYLTLNMARAANQGLSIKDTSEKFAKNIKMASRFTFSKGVDGISKMTLLSQRLKFNMESIGSAIDKFSDIEGAISTSANLQMLGGSYAANFSNPFQAMGEALLDAEGFTNRIIDTVGKSAFFNRSTGIVEMSPIDKAKMKEAAKNFGIDYNELWNMASQQAKMANIETQIKGKNFNEEQKTFLANTAQYDTVSGEWKVNIMNASGGSTPVSVSDLSQEQLAEIQKQNDVEKYIQGDVHSIRTKLDEYLGKTVSETKTMTEIITGQKERITVDLANFADDGILGHGMKDIKDILSKMSETEFALLKVSKEILGFLIVNSLGDIKDMLSGWGKYGVLKRGAKRSAKRGIIKAFGKAGAKNIGKVLGKTGAKALGKSLPYVGTAIALVDGGIETFKAVSSYQNKVNEINENQALSKEEKEKAIFEAKKERNGGIGEAVGGASGALAGIGVGMMIGGPVGAIVGGLVGVGLHYGLGKGGRALGESLTKKDETTNLTSNNLASSQVTNSSKHVNALNTNIYDSNKTNINGKTAYAQTLSTLHMFNSERNNEVINNNSELNLMQIQEDVHQIRLHQDSLYVGNKGDLLNNFSSQLIKNNNTEKSIFNNISPINQYETRTYIKDTLKNYNQQMISSKKPNIDKIDINVNGTIKLQADNKSVNIDMNEILKSNEFQRLLLSKINEGFGRNNNAVQSRSLDSTQSIMGGHYTPNQMNSK